MPSRMLRSTTTSRDRAMVMSTCTTRRATCSSAWRITLFLNSPWGVVVAPSNFSGFANELLIGNFGSGLITALQREHGAWIGNMLNINDLPVQIDGLWGSGLRQWRLRRPDQYAVLHRGTVWEKPRYLRVHHPASGYVNESLQAAKVEEGAMPSSFLLRANVMQAPA